MTGSTSGTKTGTHTGSGTRSGTGTNGNGRRITSGNARQKPQTSPPRSADE